MQEEANEGGSGMAQTLGAHFAGYKGASVRPGYTPGSLISPHDPARWLVPWYPGAEGGDPNASLLDTLAVADRVSPWRTYYRGHPLDYLANSVLVSGIFYPSVACKDL